MGIAARTARAALAGPVSGTDAAIAFAGFGVVVQIGAAYASQRGEPFLVIPLPVLGGGLLTLGAGWVLQPLS